MGKLGIPNLYDLNAKLYAFCAKHFLDVGDKLMLIIEELLQIVPLTNGVDISIEYSEKDKSLQGKLAYVGDSSVLNNENTDNLSLSIIRGMCQNLEDVDGAIKFSL